MVNPTSLARIVLLSFLTGCSLVNATSSHTGGTGTADTGPDTVDAPDLMDSGVPVDAPILPDVGRVGPPRVRVVHLARDTASVNAFSIVAGGSDEAMLATSLTFPGVSPRVDAPTGMRTINIVDSSGAVVVSELLGPFEANTDYTIAFYGDTIDPMGRGLGVLLLVDDANGLASTDVRLTVIHLATPVSEGRVVQIDPMGELSPLGVPAGNIDFLGIVEARALPSRIGYPVGFDVGGNGTLDVRFDLPGYTPGTYADVFIASRRTDGAVFLYSVTNGAGADTINVTR